MSDDRHAIATRLLSDGDSPWSWANLGLWQRGQADYATAARHLARRHGELAGLQPHWHVLDAGCGQGASLLLWQSAFGVRALTALECQTACLERLRGGPWHTLDSRFDSLPLPAGLAPASQDAVLCVDAAYHARGLTDFAAFAAAALKPGGVLVFSTLVQADRALGSWPSRWGLAAAGIPPGSQRTWTQLQRDLAANGLTLVDTQWLDDPDTGTVLQGFADFVPRRAQALTRAQRLGAGWLKIWLTGRLCGRLAAQGTLRYGLFRAVNAD